jgi:hypothetical protein
MIRSFESVAWNCHGRASSGRFKLPIFHPFVAVVTTGWTDGKVVFCHPIVVQGGGPPVRSASLRETVQHVQVPLEMRHKVDVLWKRSKVMYAIKCLA